ncbi:hypothetical protein K474DRAFT_469948 [Panus rudis PR-1116 ss-1]|nr:hypothetical protein K474DRAFT_469948 [Panus rudis PR-1116 ss-1]
MSTRASCAVVRVSLTKKEKSTGGISCKSDMVIPPGSSQMVHIPTLKTKGSSVFKTTRNCRKLSSTSHTKPSFHSTLTMAQTGCQALGDAKFPVEVMEMIIDQIPACDISTLKSCTQVCKALLPRTRYHLHRRVKLHGDSSWKEIKPERYSSPVAAQYVRELELINLFDPQFSDLRLVYVSEDSRTTSAIWEMLPRFTHLETLSLGLAACKYGEKQRETLSTLCAPITTLKLTDPTFVHIASIADLAILLDMFPRLENLEIDSVQDDGDRHYFATMKQESIPLIPPRAFPNLRRLRISCGTPSTISVVAKWLRFVFAASPPADDFRIEWHSPIGHESLPELLMSAGASLKHLVLTFPVGGGVMRLKNMDDVGLQHNTELSSLRVEFHCVMPQGSELKQTSQQLLTHLLSQVASKKLRRIDLHFSPEKYGRVPDHIHVIHATSDASSVSLRIPTARPIC